MHSKSQIKLEGANKNTASSKRKKKEMEVTCEERSLLQTHIKYETHLSLLNDLASW